jgi:hypothetical protein
MNEIRDPKVELVNEYFRRSDAGRADVTDLFTDDVEIYFPKFGIERGKSAYLNLAKGLLSYLSALAHHFHSFKYVVSGNVAVVEGTTYGRTKDGDEWSGTQTPGGRFCSVFELRGSLISRMHVYLDPDYVGLDEPRFHWGKDRQW